MTRSLLASLFLASLSAFVARPASACGGFFCNSAQPVNQNAERIIFSHNGDGTVTAVIQILYSGPAESFAWVLPVPGTPEIGISSNLAFQRLQSQTNPQYQLVTTVEGTCDELDFSSGPFPSADGVDASAGVDTGPGGVSVVDSGTVGPFDYVTIALDPETENPGDVAVDFLRDNDYDVDELGRDRLGPYLAGGMNLIAFRLTKNASTGSIRPIVMTYTSARPMIPIRPTAVAADDDMGVMVWVLGEHRAIPANYRHLVLNEALINWFSPGSNYDAVVSAAADEAGGQGFVTELAGPTSDIMPTVYNEFEALDPTSLDGLSEVDLLQQVLGRYSSYDGIRDAVANTLVLPAHITLDMFLGCPFCYLPELADEAGDIPDFESASFLAAVESQVVAPLRLTQMLLDRRPYITRLYTTMSAAEMTMDPEFDFNPDLPAFSNSHIAERIIHCSSGRTRGDAPWTTTLPDGGGVVRGEGNTWPYSLTGDLLPAARRIEQLSTSGAPQIIEDRDTAIQTQVRRDSSDFVPTPVPGAGLAGGGCTVGGPTHGVGALLIMAFFGWMIRRRRSVRPIVQ